ncbi:MAG: MarR family winged helix-turn-helix transcriptional regulator [Gemmatimonadota bacterium]
MNESKTGVALQEELRQGIPFHSPGHEAFLALLRTADVAKQPYVALFRGEGLTFQQYNVLRILRGAGPEGLPTLEIAERMIERMPGVTRILDRLVAKGLVARTRGSRDRRRVWCAITPAGLELLARLDDPVCALDDVLFEGMGNDEVRALIAALAGIRARAGELQPPHNREES